MKNILLIAFFMMSALFVLGFQSFADNREKGMEREPAELRKATFAGGCFWCTESDFEKVDGVVDAISGYTGGHKENPSYEEVSGGRSGHAEVVQVLYDPGRVSYMELLDVFWRHVDPTDSGGQFVDRGSQYRSAIFYHDDEQKRLAEESRRELETSGIFNKPIVTEIVKLNRFYPAEDYHQNFYKTHRKRYSSYRRHSGRDQFLSKIWGKMQKSTTTGKGSRRYAKPDDMTLRQKLTPLQYNVTQKDGTERPFENTYWNNKKEGIYVDIVSGEPLFSSQDKFVSGTGWPSFTRPLEPENILELEDRKFFMPRIEVRSKYGNSHLGHVFPDGPPPTGLRYCINSAALLFIPKGAWERMGYEDYLKLFTERM